MRAIRRMAHLGKSQKKGIEGLQGLGFRDFWGLVSSRTEREMHREREGERESEREREREKGRERESICR